MALTMETVNCKLVFFIIDLLIENVLLTQYKAMFCKCSVGP